MLPIPDGAWKCPECKFEMPGYSFAPVEPFLCPKCKTPLRFEPDRKGGPEIAEFEKMKKY
jgi:hypothetical protein